MRYTDESAALLAIYGDVTLGDLAAEQALARDVALVLPIAEALELEAAELEAAGTP